MAKLVKPADLGAAIQQELGLYSEGVAKRVNAKSKSAAEQLKRMTKASAPEQSGDFKEHIAIKEFNAGHGMKKYVWYVKSPDHRLTHLLVNGHATRNGGRTKGNPFLKNALEAVLPSYEQAVKEAVQDD